MNLRLQDPGHREVRWSAEERGLARGIFGDQFDRVAYSGKRFLRGKFEPEKGPPNGSLHLLARFARLVEDGPVLQLAALRDQGREPLTDSHDDLKITMIEPGASLNSVLVHALESAEIAFRLAQRSGSWPQSLVRHVTDTCTKASQRFHASPDSYDIAGKNDINMDLFLWAYKTIDFLTSSLKILYRDEKLVESVGHLIEILRGKSPEVIELIPGSLSVASLRTAAPTDEPSIAHIIETVQSKEIISPREEAQNEAFETATTAAWAGLVALGTYRGPEDLQLLWEFVSNRWEAANFPSAAEHALYIAREGGQPTYQPKWHRVAQS